MAKKNIYPKNPNVDFIDLLEFIERAEPFEHESGCAFGQNDGFGDSIQECYCSKKHILGFLDLYKAK